MISLKKTLTGVLLITGCLLFLVLLLGLLQKKMTVRYNEVIDRGENIVFRFNSLRDHLTVSLLEEKWDRFREAPVEIEAINKDLLKLVDHPFVPASYKLTLIDKVDIQGIALLARKLAADRDKSGLALQLHDRLRTLADQLSRLDRLLVGQMNDKLIQFQKMAIGALTLITGAIGLLLIALYRKGLRPLLIISGQIKESKPGSTIEAVDGSCQEIHELTGHLNQLVRAADRQEIPPPRPMFMAHTINSISNLLNGIINYSQLLLDECRHEGADTGHTAMLEKILTHSDRISSLLHQENNDRMEAPGEHPVPERILAAKTTTS